MKKVISILIATIISSIALSQSVYTLAVDIKYDSIFSLDGRFYAVKQSGKWGVVKDRQEIIPCIYQGIDALGDGVISIINNDKIGFVDTLGNLLLEPTYVIEKTVYREDKSQINVYDNGACLVEVEGDYKLIDKQNKEIIPQDYEIVSRIGDAVAVKKDGKFGIFNSKGKVLLYPQYLDISILIESKIYSFKQMTTSGIPLCGLINHKGEIICPAIYADFGLYNGKDSTYIKAYTEEGQQALLDENGKVILPASYQVCVPTKLPKYFHISQNLEQGIIGRDSVIYVPTTYERIEIMVTNDTFFLAYKENRTFIYNTHQTKIAEIEGNILDIVSNKNGETYFVIEHNFSYGIQNTKGEWVINPIYDEILTIISDNICFRKGEKWGVVNINNQTIIDFKYKEAKISPSKKFFVLYKGKKDSKLINDKGEILTFPKTESIMLTNNYIEYREKKERQKVYADGSKQPEHIQIVKASSNGILTAKTKQGWTFLTAEDYKPLTDKYYQSASTFYKGEALVYQDNQLKVINNKFQEIGVLIPEPIDNIELQLNYIGLSSYMEANYYIIKSKKKYGVINIKQ